MLSSPATYMPDFVTISNLTPVRGEALDTALDGYANRLPRLAVATFMPERNAVGRLIVAVAVLASAVDIVVVVADQCEFSTAIVPTDTSGTRG